MTDQGVEHYLNGISEDDFLRWKHHPVTKVLLRYLMDYEAQLGEHGVSVLRNAKDRPTEFQLGVFQGQINEVARLAALTFADMDDFYSLAEEEENDDA